jgi:methionine-S-sulfoxide reductase
MENYSNKKNGVLTLYKKNDSLVIMFSLLFILNSCADSQERPPADAAGSVFSLSGYPNSSAVEGNGTEISGKWIFLAGGCFWGVEKYLSLIPGVIKTEVGYANGRTAFPAYEDVCYRNTGHAETVLVEYNSAKLELSYLLDLFYKAIDPTSLNRQGNDVGAQYRTGIYYVDETDRNVIDASISQLSERTTRPVVIEVKPLENYYAAEEYHQKYLEKNPGGYCHISNDKFVEVSGLKWE